jgi:uncharacterized protein YjbJ (UPF0337 family)
VEKFAFTNSNNSGGTFMNDDRVKGKAKDVAGRIERQVGEWTGDKEKQADGTLKQAEGKVQNAWGNAKDAAKDATDKITNRTSDPADRAVESEDEDIRSRRKAS